MHQTLKHTISFLKNTMKLKKPINTSPVTVDNFNTTLSPKDRSSEQKINRYLRTV